MKISTAPDVLVVLVCVRRAADSECQGAPSCELPVASGGFFWACALQVWG
jgi:hypothetical protein